MTSVPSSRTVPWVGLRILLMQWISVVLPAPLGPMMEISCGLHISRSMPFRISTSLE